MSSLMAKYFHRRMEVEKFKYKGASQVMLGWVQRNSIGRGCGAGYVGLAAPISYKRHHEWANQCTK